MISTVDKRLIQMLAQDDTSALSQIIGKYTNYVATVIHNQLGAFSSKEDTEELTASIFVSLLQNRSRLKTTRLCGWLAATALENGKTINYCLIRSVRGMFSKSTNFVMDPERLVEWQYATADGTTVTLDLCASRSVLMAELLNSFVYVAIFFIPEARETHTKQGQPCVSCGFMFLPVGCDNKFIKLLISFFQYLLIRRTVRAAAASAIEL